MNKYIIIPLLLVIVVFISGCTGLDEIYKKAKNIASNQSNINHSESVESKNSTIANNNNNTSTSSGEVIIEVNSFYKDVKVVNQKFNVKTGTLYLTLSGSGESKTLTTFRYKVKSFVPTEIRIYINDKYYKLKVKPINNTVRVSLTLASGGSLHSGSINSKVNCTNPYTLSLRMTFRTGGIIYNAWSYDNVTKTLNIFFERGKYVTQVITIKDYELKVCEVPKKIVVHINNVQYIIKDIKCDDHTCYASFEEVPK